MTKNIKVDIGIATTGIVATSWWASLTAYLLSENKEGIEIVSIRAISSALPDHNKNNIATTAGFAGIAPKHDKGRNERTDANKSTIVGATIGGEAVKGGFMDGESEFLIIIDDDTLPPKGFISHLVGLGREYVGATVFLGAEPYNPTAYFLREDGLYDPLADFTVGELKKVDSIGMGCTLIHKSVFQKIMDNFIVFTRPNGSLVPIHKKRVYGKKTEKLPNYPQVVNGVMKMPVVEVDETDNRPWPFFAMEYGRTEDHHFAELARQVGFMPWLDTSIMCSHIKLKPIGREHHKQWKNGEQVIYEKETS